MSTRAGIRFAQARDLAFAGRLEAPGRSLDPDDRSERAGWLRAYLAAGRGTFEQAEHLAEPLATRAIDPAVRAAASLTLDSVLRQTGRAGAHTCAAGGCAPSMRC